MPETVDGPYNKWLKTVCDSFAAFFKRSAASKERNPNVNNTKIPIASRSIKCIAEYSWVAYRICL